MRVTVIILLQSYVSDVACVNERAENMVECVKKQQRGKYEFFKQKLCASCVLPSSLALCRQTELPTHTAHSSGND
jgi:hypothetical protein